VTQVRAFNRFYTNVIGVVRGVYLDSPYTLTEGRLLYEIASRDVVAVSWLRRALDIDGGYLSRVLSRFEADGLVMRQRSGADGRRQDIRATDAGRRAVSDLDARAASQVSALLEGVDAERLLGAMRVITEVLRSPRGDEPPVTLGPALVSLRPLANGDLGWVLRRHAVVYEREFGWNSDFEAVCTRIIAEYTAYRDVDPARTGGWIAEVDGAPAGCVFCVPDGPAAGDATARLRLLFVEPWARGQGLGARLVDECLRFARQAGNREIVLWTYDRLTAARRVYQAAGFTLDSEHPQDAFGHHMNSQTWSRSL